MGFAKALIAAIIITKDSILDFYTLSTKLYSLWFEDVSIEVHFLLFLIFGYDLIA